ncbi:Tubulin epsilon chain [Kappamyces sp. JEL0829]|nr:Tubulin epsilon chain [Kappamyces sp. JEL0829]
MPETLTISVGQAGNQISQQFWDLSLQEHARHSAGLGSYDECLATFYRNSSAKDGAYHIAGGKIQDLKARGLLIDMEPGVLDEISRSKLGELFDPHQMIKSSDGSGNNWAQGYHQYGTKYRDQMLEAIRKEAEWCDSLQSIMTIQSTGGGTGSGLGSALSELIREEMPKIWRFGVAIVPSDNDDVVTSPYNSVLSLSKLSQSCDCILPVDNQSLITIYERILQQPGSQKKPQSSLADNYMGKVKLYDQKKNEAFHTMNNIVANLILNLTSSMRFEGSLNVDINDIVTNLVPFPHLNFLTSSMTPFFATKDIKSSQKMLDQMFTDAFLPEAQLLSVDPRSSAFLACALIARGPIEISDLRRNIDRMKQQLHFVRWNADGWKTGLCDVAPIGQQHSILALSNNTGFWRISDRIGTRFNRLFKRRAHLHHYLEWMDESEFSQAQERIRTLTGGYKALESKTLSQPSV